MCPSLRFRCSRSSRGSFCKSSSALTVCFSLDGPPTEVTSPTHRVRLALSSVQREPKASFSRRCHLLTEERQAMNLLSTRNPSTSLTACRRRNQQHQSSLCWCQTLGSGRSGAESACTEPAHSGRFVGAQHGRTRNQPRGPCRVSRPPAPCNWTAAATVMGIKLNGASVSRNNRPSASYQFPATTSLFHITFLTILLLNSSTVPFSQKPSGRRPLHFHACAAYRSATRF